MAEYIVRLAQPVRRPADDVRAQFMDIAHHARGGVHPELQFTVLDQRDGRVRYRQETRLLGMRQIDVVEAVRNADGTIDYLFLEGMNKGSRINFSFRPDGDGTVIDACAYLQLGGWKRLIARPFCAAFRKVGSKALDEDRHDLESGHFQRAAA
ncbi:MAG: hypothetical protein ACXVCV_01530 [Polyangia bacterium]